MSHEGENGEATPASRAPRGFIQCRTCAERQQTQRLEVGLTDTGLIVLCKKHGLVGEFTPEGLSVLLAHPPECECCRARKELS